MLASLTKRVTARRSSLRALVLVFLTISVSAPLLFIEPAAAATAQPVGTTSLGLHGGAISLLPVSGDSASTSSSPSTATSAAAVTPVSTGVGANAVNPIAATVLLGAPITTTNVLAAPDTTQVALGLTWGDVGSFLGKVTVGSLDCSVVVVFTLSVGRCADDLADVVKWAASDAITKVFRSLSLQLAKATSWAADMIFVQELGTNNAVPRPELSVGWFAGQYSLMRSMALYVMLPLLMLMIIQAVVKGSLFFMLRSMLLMLPVAIIGTVLLVTLTEQLMNIADDMSAAIASYVTDVPAFAQNMQQAADASATDVAMANMGLFSWVWMFIFIVGAIIIYFELLVRSLAIYLAVFFMPLAFAALVWPPSAKMAKRLLELLMGLIFSKVILAAALSLGIAAMAGVSTDGLRPADAGDAAGISNVNAALGAGLSGAVITLLALFAFMKAVSGFAPAMDTVAQNRPVNTAALWGKGQVAALGLSKGAGAVQGKIGRIKPKGTGLT